MVMPEPSPDLHANIRATVEAMPDSDTRGYFLDMLDNRRHSPCCHPASDVTDHITATAIVVHPDRRQVLLCLHKLVGRWLHLGGHAEPGDNTLVDSALREAAEESGLTDLRIGEALFLDLHPVTCRYGPSVHFDIAYPVLAASAKATVSDESEALAWYGPYHFPRGTFEKIDRMSMRALNWAAGQP